MDYAAIFALQRQAYATEDAFIHIPYRHEPDIPEAAEDCGAVMS